MAPRGVAGEIDQFRIAIEEQDVVWRRRRLRLLPDQE